MSAQSSRLSSAPHRLDNALFGLRWLFLAGMGLLAWLANETILENTTFDQGKLLFSLSIGSMANLIIGLVPRLPGFNERVLSILNLVLDSVLAALFFWAFDGDIVPLFLLGSLSIIVAAYRLGWGGSLLTLAVISSASLVGITQLEAFNAEHWVLWGLSMGFLFAFGLLGTIFRGSGRTGSINLAYSGDDTRLAEAHKLRVTRERAQAIFDMATTLSSTLNHQHVLTEAQSIGLHSLRDQLDESTHLISVVMLFQGQDNQLRVVTSRGLARRDQEVALPGRQGVLGLALQQAEPVFGGDPRRDPELKYFVSFQDIKSVLAIPLRAGIDVYGVMIFGSDQPQAFSDEHAELMTAIGTQSTLALQNAVLFQNLLTEKEKIVEVEEGARKKLARDLHDGPTQSVAAIAMRVNYTRRLIERQPQQAIDELWKIEDLARRTTKEIRHMLFTLRPLVLETQGLLAALAQLAEKMRDTHDTNVVLKALPDVENFLDTNAQGVIFYIVEEAVNNARKHAQSEHIWVRLYHKDNQYVVIEIEDDGVGFDVGAVNENYDQRGSLGMINMRERAELIEGTVRVQSAKGRGTKISVIVPIDQTAATNAEAEIVPPLELQSHREGAIRSGDVPTPPPTRQISQQPDPSDPFALGGAVPPVPPAQSPSPSPPSRPSRPDRPQNQPTPADTFANGGFNMAEPPAAISKPSRPNHPRTFASVPSDAAEATSTPAPASAAAPPVPTAAPAASQPKPPQQRTPVKPNARRPHNPATRPAQPTPPPKSEA